MPAAQNEHFIWWISSAQWAVAKNMDFRDFEHKGELFDPIYPALIDSNPLSVALFLACCETKSYLKVSINRAAGARKFCASRSICAAFLLDLSG